MKEDSCRVLDFPSRFDLMVSLFEKKLINFSKKSADGSISNSEGVVMAMSRVSYDSDFWTLQILITSDANPAVEINNIYIINYNLKMKIGFMHLQKYIPVITDSGSVIGECAAVLFLPLDDLDISAGLYNGLKTKFNTLKDLWEETGSWQNEEKKMNLKMGLSQRSYGELEALLRENALIE